MKKKPVVGARFWESVTREHEATTAETRYFGVVKRVPVAAFPRKEGSFKSIAMEWDESHDELHEALPDSLPVSMQGWEPVPNATIRRPDTMCSSVAMAEACATGGRKLGISTAGPIPIRSVRSAIRARCTQMSWPKAGISGDQMRS